MTKDISQPSLSLGRLGRLLGTVAAYQRPDMPLDLLPSIHTEPFRPAKVEVAFRS